MSRGRTERVALSVPSDLRYGEAVRALLDALAKRLERETGTETLRAHVVSAFGEAFNNVVEHAYRGARDGRVEIEVVVDHAALHIAVTDEGASFDAAGVEEPDLDALPVGGLGLQIIRSFMTEARYTTTGARNTLRMRKDFARPLVLAGDRQTWS
jgi:serine/threonine-protein kinase RsbW